MGTLNDQLAKVYNEKWDELQKQLKNADVQSPFLLSTRKDATQDEKWYADADLKVMFMGKEPSFWQVEDKDEGPEGIMALYENFYASKYKEHKNGAYFSEDNTTSPFFKMGCNWIMSVITERLHSDKRAAFMWNNISKFSTTNGEGVSPEVHAIECEYFHVIPQEIQILTPDVIIFFTGPKRNKYYNYICENFTVMGEPEQLAGLPTDDVAKLNLKEVKLAYKTYHPQASITGEERRKHYEDAIIDDIMKNMPELF